jgi:hypothetical protein
MQKDKKGDNNRNAKYVTAQPFSGYFKKYYNMVDFNRYDTCL